MTGRSLAQVAASQRVPKSIPPEPYRLQVSEEVASAQSRGVPVVALESTLIAHGLPWPDNVELALEVEQVIRTAGAIPATVALIGGTLCVGLERSQIEAIARGHFVKVAAADLGPLMASGGDGATTVSATVYAAARAGVRVFATGGIGGVHRGDAWDVSSDLTTLASEPVCVVSAGAKAILDLPRTLEYLETLGVPVIGYGTSELPAFYSRRSGLTLPHRVDNPAQAAAVLHAHFALHPFRGLLLCNPIPEPAALDDGLIERAIASALHSAEAAHISGKQVTPFLLSAIAKETENRSILANRALVLANAQVAAAVAVELGALFAEAPRD
ncbi:MAG: pseudouridine-5'-phosphate glycosidase [Myxococcales bacterium]|nr:pseudouridine-5'-phosphate glycosidase [Myxococcales bacterium]